MLRVRPQIKSDFEGSALYPGLQMGFSVGLAVMGLLVGVGWKSYRWSCSGKCKVVGNLLRLTLM